jgi:hypothetical protein
MRILILFSTANPGGPTQGYDYDRHFVFQGHENSGNLAYITTRILDDAQIAEIVGMNAFVSRTTENSMQRVDRGWPTGLG